MAIQYDGASGNEGTVVQSGADTYSYLAQTGSGNVADVQLSGTGDANARYTTSEGYTFSPGVPAESEVWQVGNSDKATVEQISDSSTARIYQGLSYQSGDLDYAIGSGNEATIRQYAGSDDARADIYQGGSDNIATTLQTASLSTAMVYQDGTGNSSGVDQQSGSGHSATVTQYADGNSSSVLQTGTGNTATVGQYSNGNGSTVTQGGSANVAVVTQGN